jgi:hypothetical protein
VHFSHDPLAMFVEAASGISRLAGLGKSPLRALADYSEGGKSKGNEGQRGRDC